MADTLVSLGLDDAEYRAGVERALKHMARLGSGAATTGAATKQAGSNAGIGFYQLAMAIEDAQYGMRGIMNNIPGMVMGFGATMGQAAGLQIALVGATTAGKKGFEMLANAILDTAGQEANLARLAAEADAIDKQRMEDFAEGIQQEINATWQAVEARRQLAEAAERTAKFEEASTKRAQQVEDDIERMARQQEELDGVANLQTKLIQIETDLATARDRNTAAQERGREKLRQLADQLVEEEAALADFNARRAEFADIEEGSAEKVGSAIQSRIDAIKKEYDAESDRITQAGIAMEGADKLAEAEKRLAIAKEGVAEQSKREDEAQKEATRRNEEASEAADDLVGKVLEQADAYKKAAAEGRKMAEATREVADGLRAQSKYFGDQTGRQIAERGKEIAEDTGLRKPVADYVARAETAMEAAESAYMDTRAGQIRAASQQRTLEREGRLDNRIIERIAEEQKTGKTSSSRILGDDGRLRRAMDEMRQNELDKLDPKLQPVTEATIIKLTSDIQACFGQNGGEGANTYLRGVKEKLAAVVGK